MFQINDKICFKDKHVHHVSKYNLDRKLIFRVVKQVGNTYIIVANNTRYSVPSYMIRLATESELKLNKWVDLNSRENMKKQIFKELYFKCNSQEHGETLLSFLKSLGYIDYTVLKNKQYLMTTKGGTIHNIYGVESINNFQDISWLEKEYEELNLVVINGSKYLKEDVDNVLKNLNIYG